MVSLLDKEEKDGAQESTWQTQWTAFLTSWEKD